MNEAVAVHEAISMNMEFLFSSSVLLATSLVLILFSFIASHFFRINKEDSLKKEDANKILTMKEISQSNYKNYYENLDDKEEVSGLTFKFQYQITNDRTVTEENQSPLATGIHKYQFVTEKDLSGFVEKPEINVCHLEESFLSRAISYSDEKEKNLSRSQIDDINASPHKDYENQKRSFGAPFGAVVQTVDQQASIKGNRRLSKENLEEQMVYPEELYAGSRGEIERQSAARFLVEEFSGLNSDSESLSVSDGYSVKDLLVDSDGILSDEDVDEFDNKSVTSEESTTSSTYKLDLPEHRSSEEAQLQYFYESDKEYSASKDLFNDLNSGPEQKESESSGIQNPGEVQVVKLDAINIELIDSSDDELLHLTQDHTSTRDNYDKAQSKGELVDEQNSQGTIDMNVEQSATEFQSSNENSSQPLNTNFDNASVKFELSQLKGDLDGHKTVVDESEEKEEAEKRNAALERNNMKDFDEDEDMDSLWEHADIIEQLKMEIRKTRTNGLPTIFEESESPKSVEDLKPWKIDDKSLHEDPIIELHKFYRSYKERMRKLDILNYQKMYAIGFLQLKDPLESPDTQNFCTPTITSIMSQNCPLRWKFHSSSSEDFIKELRCDMELVYVAQMCLSWEFLRWQYEKARDLPESNSYRNYHYNQVAGEFQQFQVNIQRFIENEEFQGPRLQNYVKNRCVLRNLLQVPEIKVDNLKSKKDGEKESFIITSEMLEDIMEESIRIFWEFVKADKDETILSFLKGLMGANVELQDPSDRELLVDIQSDLQKKEKKLIDILRTGNCLVKKFKKPKEDRSNQDVFFSQIDLKLVARVLRMPRIKYDQLVWCQKKMSKIIIVDRKIHREASFFLFPC